MHISEKIEQATTDILNEVIKSQKSSKILSLLTDEIIKLAKKNITVSKQCEIINRAFNTNIKESTFSSFFYRNIKKKINSNSTQKVEKKTVKKATPKVSNKVATKSTKEVTQTESKETVDTTPQFIDVKIDTDTEICEKKVGDEIINEIGFREIVVDFLERDLSKKGFSPDLEACYAINHSNASSEQSKRVRKLIEKPLGEINYKFEFFKNCRFKNTYKPINLGALTYAKSKEREKKLIKSIFDADYRNLNLTDVFREYKNKYQIVVHEKDEYRKIDPLNRMSGFDLDYSTEKPLEKFVFFPNMFLLQIADLSTLNFVDGQAILLNNNPDIRPRSSNYDLYRYHKGELYFVSQIHTSGRYSPALTYYIQENFDMVASAEFKLLDNAYSKFRS